MNIKKSILLRVRIVFLLMFLFGMSVIGMMAKVQVVDGKKWKAKAEEIGLQFRKIPATRGNIYSDNGSLLATSVPLYRLAFDPTVVSEERFREQVDSLAANLAEFFRDRSKEAYLQRMQNARDNQRQYLVLNRNYIGYQDKKLMSEWPIFRYGQARGGVIFEKVERRVQPFSRLGRRTIGYLDEEGNGRGLEYSFNQLLEGKDGQGLFQKVAGGNWKPVPDSDDMPPRDGYDIVSTLDVNLQDVAESALLRHLLQHEANYGCVVVMEVATGEIKAISNLTRGRDGQYYEDYNYAVQGLSEPGSTFKLASMIALFEDSNLQPTDTIETGNGVYEFYGTEIHDAKPGGYGRLSVHDAFAKSSNIAVMKMVDAHFGQDPQRYVDYLHAMGLGQPLGFQMIGEGVPNVKQTTDESWSKISHLWMSIGYEVQLTPLQVLALYNAVANDGKLIQPIIVKEATVANKVVREFEAGVISRKIASDRTLGYLRAMLEQVVISGTARNIAGTHYSIAGKTGTAQKYINGAPSQRYYTSFAGYFPADEPKYSAIVVIDDPQGYRQYGSDVAAPVFKEIADKIYAQDLDLHDPQPDTLTGPEGIFPVIRAGHRRDLEYISKVLDLKEESVSDQEWVRTRLRGDTIQWVDGDVERELVPDVTGMTLRDALYLLENRGLRVDFEGAGRVVEQSQLPGVRAVKGSRIKLVLG